MRHQDFIQYILTSKKILKTKRTDLCASMIRSKLMATIILKRSKDSRLFLRDATMKPLFRKIHAILTKTSLPS